MAKILMVEDSPTNAALYAAFLEDAGHTVLPADTGKQALKIGADGDHDLMLLDLQLPDMNGLELLSKLRDDGVVKPVVVLTGNGSVRVAVDAMRDGAMDFLMKPCSAEKLTETIGSALERFDSRATEGSAPAESDGRRPEENKTGKSGQSGFLGNSAAMRNVFSLIEAAARSDASVFITGESGTGKELCAQAIHKSSGRHNGPFVPLNCAAIPRELMESEIFGHRKGAFTGAVGDREGAAAFADGGTLFLDELCEMDLDLQAKLLRFIQTGGYKRVGDEAERRTDIRFVCATNRDPLLEVREGRFREDLYYRLYVVPIQMPPLRERGRDIQELAERFLRDFAAIEGKQFRHFGADALYTLHNHPWPGNVRELENAVRNIVVLHDGEEVARDMLPPTIGSGGALSSPMQMSGEAVASNSPGTPPADWLVRPIEELEIMAIDAAIEKFNGNVSRASRELGISTSSIYRKKKAWDEKSGSNLDS